MTVASSHQKAEAMESQAFVGDTLDVIPACEMEAKKLTILDDLQDQTNELAEISEEQVCTPYSRFLEPHLALFRADLHFGRELEGKTHDSVDDHPDQPGIHNLEQVYPDGCCLLRLWRARTHELRIQSVREIGLAKSQP